MVLGVGGIVGGAVGLGGAVYSARIARKNANKQEALARQKAGLYSKLTESNLREASENYRQTASQNLFSQAMSGIELNSETFRRLNQQVYNDYLQDVERINLQGNLYQLGVESEIVGINAQRPSTVQSALTFLNASVAGASSGVQFANMFQKNNIKPAGTTSKPN